MARIPRPLPSALAGIRPAELKEEYLLHHLSLDVDHFK